MEKQEVWLAKLFNRAKHFWWTRQTIHHALKTWPAEFRAVRAGQKLHDVRLDDRGFEVGQVLKLDEYLPDEQRYTQAFELVAVSYITRGPSFGLPRGMVVMSLVHLGLNEANSDPWSFSSARRIDVEST